MNRSDITKKIASGTGLPQRDVAEVVNGVFECMNDELLAGKNIEIRGFGTFKIIRKQQRRGVNPRTGEIILINEAVTVSFHPSTILKDRLNHQ